MADKQDSILKRLAELLASRQDAGTGQSSSSSNTPEPPLQRLFPSVRRPSPMPSSPSLSVKLGKGTGNRAKKPYSRTSKPSKPVIKDVILLPDPRMDNVPRGAVREELYLRELVTSAVEIPSEMNEVEIRQLLEGLFANKLKSHNGHKFQFVRVVGNKVVQPKTNRQWDAKMIKHIAGQGPIYIRSWRKIEQDFAWVDDDHEEIEDDDDEMDENDKIQDECKVISDDDDDDKDDELLKPAFGMMSSPCNPNSTTSVTPPNPSSNLASSASNCASQSSIIDLDAYSTSQIPFSTSNSHTVSPSTSTSTVTSTIMCPTCHTSFPVNFIEEHADMCCERVARASELAYNNLMLTMEAAQGNDDGPSHDIDTLAESIEENKSTELKDIIERIRNRVSTKSSHINVQRKFILDDYMEGRKRPWIKPENRLSVVFIGEPAVDDGGPRREFFTEIFDHVQRRFFIQKEDQDGYIPLDSTVALTEGSFKITGELMAMSLAQGGPAPNFLASWVYDFLSSGLDAVPAQIENMPEGKFRRVAEKLMAVETEQDLQTLLTEDDAMDVLSEVGYRGVPQREKLKNKEKLLRSVYIKVYVEPRIPMLNQIAKGLELYGVLDEITKNREEMKKVFTLVEFEDLTNETLRGLCSVNFSLPQKMKEDEILTYKAFADFICMIEYEGMSKYDLSLADVLKFITGCRQVPPLGFSKKIDISFIHGCRTGCQCRPTASTCGLELRLPTHIKSFDDMVSAGVSMLKECFGFGSV